MQVSGTSYIIQYSCNERLASRANWRYVQSSCWAYIYARRNTQVQLFGIYNMPSAVGGLKFIVGAGLVPIFEWNETAVRIEYIRVGQIVLGCNIRSDIIS